MTKIDLSGWLGAALLQAREIHDRKIAAQGDTATAANTQEGDWETAADIVIAGIPAQMLTAAQAGHDYALVMILAPQDHNGDDLIEGRHNKLVPESLRGVAEIVYSKCAEASHGLEIQTFFVGGPRLVEQRLVIGMGFGKPNPDRFD